MSELNSSSTIPDSPSIKPKKTFKILVGGDGGVGKTTYLNVICTGEYSCDTKLTVGVGFFKKSFEIDGNQLICSFWDLGGQEQFRFLHENYVRGADMALVFFALDRWISLMNVYKWIELLHSRNPLMPIVLVGSKSDLEREDEKISQESIQDIIDEHNLLGYVRISSKTEENIKKPMEMLVEIAKTR